MADQNWPMSVEIPTVSDKMSGHFSVVFQRKFPTSCFDQNGDLVGHMSFQEEKKLFAALDFQRSSNAVDPGFTIEDLVRYVRYLLALFYKRNRK